MAPQSRPSVGPSRTTGPLIASLPMLALVVALVVVESLDLPLYLALAGGFGAAWLVGSTLRAGPAQLADLAWRGIRRIAPVLVILACVGAMTAAWLASGTVPGLIYYGLSLVSPGVLVVAGFVLASLTSMVLGSSIGTLSTVGIALMGVARAAGAPLPLMAGALASGALLGDRTSPLSGTFHLTANMTETPVDRTLKALVPSALPAWLLSLAGFLVLGASWRPAAGAGHSLVVESFTRSLAANFTISWVVLLPPLIVFALAALHRPVNQSLAAGLASGIIISLLLQHHPLVATVRELIFGYAPHSGSPALDAVISGGGLLKMVNTVLLLVFAGAFSGIMEGLELLEALVSPVLARIRHTRSLLVATMALSCLTAATVANQVLSIIIPARLMRTEYARRRVPSEVLARMLADSGSVVSPLIPWNLMAVISSTALGLPASAYGPYGLLMYLFPLVSLVWIFTRRIWSEAAVLTGEAAAGQD